MSPVTKTLIVLHVLLSLVLSAGLVVFVNRVENFKTTNEGLKNSLAGANAAAAQASSDAQSAKAAADTAVAQANSQVSDLQKQLQTAQGQIADLGTQAATAASDKAIAAAQTGRLTEALKSSEDAKGKQADQIALLRTTNDGLAKSNNDLNLAISDLTNKLDVTERNRRNATEQVAQLTAQVDNDKKLLLDNGIKESTTGGLGAGAVPINGVVRDEPVAVNQIPYATISVGSTDGVQPGMQFKVIDRTSSQFLGYLTVKSVEPNSATGQLEGPGINNVHAGTEVRTQL